MLPQWPWCFFLGLFTLFPTHRDPGRHGRGPGVPGLRCAVRQRRSSISWHLGIRWLLTFTRFSTQGRKVTPHLRALFPYSGVRWLLAFTRFSLQGHQVTPHLSSLFNAGSSSDSSPSRFYEVTYLHREGPISPWMSERAESSTHGRRWCGAAIVWMRGYTLLTAAADVGLVSCEWECPSTHGSHWCGAGIMWMRVSSTHGRPLLGGWYRVNKRAVSFRHGSHWWGAGIVWMREQCLPDTAATDEGLVSCEWESSVFQTRQPLMRGWYRVNKRAVSSRHGSHWWGAGIVWMIEETSDYVLHTAEHCSEAGGCMLRQWLFCTASAATWKPLAPVFFPRLAAPPWKGDVRSRVAVLSCRFNGWEECGHSRHKLITKVLKSTTGQGQIDSS